MAVVEGPCFSQEASGVVGPLQYCFAVSRTMARSRISPNDTRSHYQGEYRRLGFLQTSFGWINTPAANVELLFDLANVSVTDNRLGQKIKMNAFQIYSRSIIPENYYNPPGGLRMESNNFPDYFPELSIVWTASGYELSWDPAIGQEEYLVVKQWRNLLGTQRRFEKKITSHIIKSDKTSPQLISGSAGGSAGPRQLPPVVAGLWTNFSVTAYSLNQTHAPRVNFRVQAA